MPGIFSKLEWRSCACCPHLSLSVFLFLSLNIDLFVFLPTGLLYEDTFQTSKSSNWGDLDPRPSHPFLPIAFLLRKHVKNVIQAAFEVSR